MKFVPSRDLRLKTRQVFEMLKEEGEIIVTTNGIPVALIIPIDESSIENNLRLINLIKIKSAVSDSRESTMRNGIKSEDIAKEIDAIVKEKDSK